MTTTTHPMIREAEAVIERASSLLEHGFSRELGGMGVPEAVALAAVHDHAARTIAERALAHAGIDVWWSDLLCIDGEDASRSVRAVLPIDPAELYGPNWEAVLGLIRAASLLTAAQLNGISNVVDGATWRLFDECVAVAAGAGRERLFIRVCEDVHFATKHYASTPAGITRQLRGIRGLECVGAYYVLADIVSAETARQLCEPVGKIIFPLATFMR